MKNRIQVSGLGLQALGVVAVLLLSARTASAQTLQAALDRAMAERAGGAVVISVQSGSIFASYHPQIVGQRATLPGSAIKPFVLLELLRSGKVSANTEWMCRRHVQVGSHNLDCQHVRTVEAMDAERALAYSCNSYFTEMGARLGDVELTAALRRAGFSSATRLISPEAVGAFRRASTREELQLKAVGEHGIAVTPIQMAAAYRWLVVQWRNPDAAINTVMDGLESAVKYGTAQGAQVKGLEVAGKTGTSTAEEGAWTHAWFAGFAPAAKPKVVIVVFLERGHGSEAAEVAGAALGAWAKGARR